MLIFLYGPDSYRRLQKLNEIVDAYRQKHSGLSHERFDLSDEAEFEKFQNFAANQSIFNPVRLAILDGFDSFDKLRAGKLKELKAILKSHFEDKSLAILVNSDKKPPATFNILLKKPTQTWEFPSLKGTEIIGLINETSKKLGLKLDNRMIRVLAQTFGNNTWGIVTELERMALVSDGAKTISIHKPADNFFQLINAIKYGRRLQDRLVALEIILSDRKDEPAKVFNMLAFRLRNEAEANLLADYDVAVKSGKLEYEEVLLAYTLG